MQMLSAWKRNERMSLLKAMLNSFYCHSSAQIPFALLSFLAVTQTVMTWTIQPASWYRVHTASANTWNQAEILKLVYSIMNTGSGPGTLKYPRDTEITQRNVFFFLSKSIALHMSRVIHVDGTEIETFLSVGCCHQIQSNILISRRSSKVKKSFYFEQCFTMTHSPVQACEFYFVVSIILKRICLQNMVL